MPLVDQVFFHLWGCCLKSFHRSPRCSRLGVMNSWIEKRVGDIDQEIGQDKNNCEKESGALNYREVTVDNRGNGERAEPRPGEDVFEDDGAAKQASKGEPEDGDHRNQGISQDV